MKKPIIQNIANISLLVENYDDAIDFYTQKLQFTLIEDTDLGRGKRWVIIAPKNTNSAHLLLAKASDEQQQKSVGNQTGGRVFLFLETNDFWHDYHTMKNAGVHFLEDPREETYATVCVFKDLYGNKWDLLQRNN